MSLSQFEWVIVHEDGSSDVVVSDCIDDVIESTSDAQPIAIIRGKNVFYR